MEGPCKVNERQWNGRERSTNGSRRKTVQRTLHALLPTWIALLEHLDETLNGAVHSHHETCRDTDSEDAHSHTRTEGCTQYISWALEPLLTREAGIWPLRSVHRTISDMCWWGSPGRPQQHRVSSSGCTFGRRGRRTRAPGTSNRRAYCAMKARMCFGRSGLRGSVVELV